MSLFRILHIGRVIYKEIKNQKEFNKNFLVPYLNALEIRHQGKFSKEQKEKIVNYYGMFITSFLCSSYKRLHGKTLSAAERKRATLFGILTPVGDDLFDIDKLDNESIRAITFDPDHYEATTFSSKVAKEIQSFQLKNVPHLIKYIAAAQAVLDIQIETEKQIHAILSKEELERITFSKGAASVIIYYQILEDLADDKMFKALDLIGSLFQLGNDVFDLYKDVRDDIHTLVNTCPDFIHFKNEFTERVALQNKAIMNLSYPADAKKDFCLVVNIINARSLVAIDQLIDKQKQWGKQIQWNQLDRKEMICDMEKPINLLKWLYYIWKIPNY